MKNLTLKRPLYLMVLVAIVSLFSFTSCSKEGGVDVVYTIGLTTANEPNMLDQVKLIAIQKVIETKLGASNASFKFNGTNESCDAKVLVLCKPLDAVIKALGYSFDVDYAIGVTNTNTGKVIYKFSL